ncbi:choice-of-anchor L domain-containing protein [uncultured Flavobacterium sp.]|uniref:choice-of-anchor L domain-containing protein n=1 Tax=uncultured Flavobacterium sp. TaxID=165435 RepID=UPI0025CC70A9|nr:choice-of-anchor L domain-containing protein [uncultured Flavobacterium sp.]
MKRIISALSLTLLFSLCCYAQEFEQDFEGAWTAGTGPNTGPAGGWGIYENGIGTSIHWVQSTAGSPMQPVHGGSHAAYLNKESVPSGIAEDWLVTPQFTVPEESQVRFFSRLTTPQVEANIYEVRISSAPIQGDLDDYVLLEDWTETEINPVYNVYTEKVVNIPAEYFGQQVYIALVMKNNNGDRWLVDDFRVVKKCLAPTDITIPADGITENSAQISWTNNSGASQWIVEAVPQDQPFTETGETFNTQPPVTLFGLEDSTVYKVRIRAVCGPGMESDWSAPAFFTTAYTAPDNDECDNALALTVNPTQLCAATTQGRLIEATASAQANTCTGMADDDVWFEFTATNTKHVISLDNITGSSTDLVHAVYEGGCGTLALRYCSDPNSSNALNLTVGQTYKVRVYSKPGTPQTTMFSVCVTTPPPPPDNDECAGAVTVPVNDDDLCTLTVPGTVYSATASPQPNTCGGSDDDDVWFEFTATNTSHIISLLDITGGTPDLFHVVYHGDGCGSLAQLYCSNPESSVANGLIVGEKYKVRVYSFTGTGGQTSAFNICVGTPPPPPANDECAAATVLAVNPTLECTSFMAGTVSSATPSAEANTCTGSDDDDVWYQFTATGTTHNISLYNVTGSTNNLVHVLYEGNDCATLAQLYCSDPNNSTALNLTVGQVYKIRVYTFSSTTGQNTSFNICVNTLPPPPANDECANATIVPVNPTDVCTQKVSGTVLSATASPQPITCNGSPDDDVWFEFTAANNTQLISLSDVSGSAPDLYHAVYSGTDCGALVQLYCSDGNNSVAGGLTAGQVYKIRVYSTTAQAGQTTAFQVCVATPPPPPANDDCANAVVVPVNAGTDCVAFAPGTLYSATASPQANICNGTADDDVWFTFTATQSNHDIDITNITGSTNVLVHALYRGTDCGALTPVYCNTTNSSNASYLVPGQQYMIRIFTTTADPGQTSAFNVCVTTPQQPIFTDDTTNTVPELISEVLVSTACAQVTNLTWKTGVTEGFEGDNGIAYFNANGSGFPIEEGVVLSTGRAFRSRGPNTTELSNGNEAWTGDDDLFNYIQGLGIDPGLEDYNNATVVEFDFVPLTAHISFPFVFASEEYGQYQCNFSDAFAFFLTNTATGATTNLALLPGTDTPISVVTIRDNANDDCPAANPEYYGQNNQGGNAMAADINYNGQTVLLTAQSDVEVNTVYHIKLVIADRNDELLDSAVFIGPFDIGNIDLGEDFLVETGNALCEGDTYTIDSELDPALYAIEWLRNDVVIPGATAPAVTISEPGTYTIQAQYISSTCVAVETKVIEFYDSVAATTGDPENLVICNTNGTAQFDFTGNTAILLEGLEAGDYSVSYHISQEDADNDEGPIGPVYQNTVSPQTIFVRIVNNGNGCMAFKQFTITAQVIDPDFDIEEGCRGNKYMLEIVALDGTFDPETATYAWTGPGGFTASAKEIEVPGAGDYSVTVTTAEGCQVSATRTIGENSCLVPRGISPNGDNMNETFDLTGMDVTKITIFNRYGTEVFSYGAYVDQWHGQDSGNNELPSGTYFYSIETGSGESKTGWVYINREE